MLIILLSPILYGIYEYRDYLSKSEFVVIDTIDAPLSTPLEIVKEPKRLAIDDFTAGIKDDGTLWTWGHYAGFLREIANGKTNDPTPRPVKGISNAIAVVTSPSSPFVLLKANGTVWAWGEVGYTDIIIEPNDTSHTIKDMRQIKGIDDVIDITITRNNLAFLTHEGEVYIMGDNASGWVNDDLSQKILKTPTRVPNLKNIVRIEIGDNLLLALNKDGNLYSTGPSTYNLGRRTNTVKESNSAFHIADKVDLPKKVVDFVATSVAPMALLEDGNVWIWGKQKNITMKDRSIKSYYIDLYNEITKEKVPNGLIDEALLPVKHELLHKIINIGENQAVTEDGGLYVWGTYQNTINRTSEYDSNYTIFKQPRLIKRNVKPLQLYYSRRVSAVAMKDGSVYFWHMNSSGQRGNGKINLGEMTDDYIFTPEKSQFTLN